MSVVIETTLGDITVDLYLKERPNACLNFLKLCKVKYYNLCIFHKVERNFIAQTGDPTSTGRGGESIFCRLYGEQAKYFDAELKPRLKHEKLGTLSMVTNSNNMNGSQFFITLGEKITYLDEVHTVFGEVVEGFEVLLKINEAICDPDNHPYQDIRITHTVVLHDPYDDPTGLEIPDGSPIPTQEQLESNYIGADEEIDDTKGKTAEEIEEKIKESEAKARATILEMVGDLPDADVKPPDNVLFVCKLNPVTTSEDLEIIFSRFGPIVSCEVIKDKKTGDSLQYAFIEFENEEDCENAYFKMDNVLIDDRRIHVDFSQSVSKLNPDTPNNYNQQTSGRFKNFLIKDKQKKSDGYEMIFDMKQESTSRHTDKHRSSPRRKHSSPNNHSDRSHYKKSSKDKYKEKDRHSSSSDKYSSHHKSSRSDRNYRDDQYLRNERSSKRDYKEDRYYKSYKEDQTEYKDYKQDYREEKSHKKCRKEEAHKSDYRDKESYKERLSSKEKYRSKDSRK